MQTAVPWKLMENAEELHPLPERNMSWSRCTLVVEHVAEGCTEGNKQPIFMEMKNVGLFRISDFTSSEPKLMFHDHSKEKENANKIT